jgi:hypothetical protein
MSEELHNRPLRFELKYIIPLDVGQRLWTELEPHCVPDEHGDPEFGYEVSSLYFDTNKLRFHYDRQESTGYRRKVRLRAYGVEGTTPVPGGTPFTPQSRCAGLFMEIKEKHKHQVGKKRCRLINDSIISAYPDNSKITIDELEPYMPPDYVATREVLYLHKQLGLNPVALIRYIRKSFAGKFEPGLRITLDYRITVGGRSLLTYDPVLEKFIIPPTVGVLEIKSFGTIPVWLQNTLLRFELSRTRMSKYCEAVIVQSERQLFDGGGSSLTGSSETMLPEINEKVGNF